MCILLFDITGGDNDSEIHTISPAHRIGERTDFSAYPDSCAGRCAGICGQYFRSELLYCLSAGGGRKTLFRRASVFLCDQSYTSGRGQMVPGMLQRAGGYFAGGADCAPD